MSRQPKAETIKPVREDTSRDVVRSLIDDEIFIPEKDKDFCVSTGSLLLDMATGGGLRPSVIRMTGQTEAGKTSCSLSIIKNFLETVPNAKGLIIPSEGRLREGIKKRSGVAFVENVDDWTVGTCLIIYTNIFEKA